MNKIIYFETENDFAMDKFEEKIDKTQKTVNAYDELSEIYAYKYMNYEVYVRNIKEFVEYLDEDDDVLDLCCGPGNVGRQLMLCGKNVSITAVDLSEKMLEIAKKNVPEAEFYCQDIRTIDFAEESFDAIMLSFGIVHLTDNEMKQLIEKIAKYLKPGGKLYLSFIEGTSKEFETTIYSKEAIFFNYYLTEEIENVLKDNGIEIFKINKQDYPESEGIIKTEVFVFAQKKDIT